MILLEYPEQQDLVAKTRDPEAPTNDENWREKTGIPVATGGSIEDCMKNVGPFGPEAGYSCCLQTSYGDYFSAGPRCPKGTEVKYWFYTKMGNPYYRTFDFEPNVCEVALAGTKRCGKIGSIPLNSSMSLGSAEPWTGPYMEGFKNDYLINTALDFKNSLFVDYWLDTKTLRNRDISRIYSWMGDLLLATNQNTNDEETGTLFSSNVGELSRAARRAMVHVVVAMLSNVCFREGRQDDVSRLSKASLNSYMQSIVIGYCNGLRQSRFGVFLGGILGDAKTVSEEVAIAHKTALSVSSSLDAFSIELEEGTFYITFGISYDLLDEVRKEDYISVFKLQKFVDVFYEDKQVNKEFPNVELDLDSVPEVKVVFCRVDSRGFSLSNLETSFDKGTNNITLPPSVSQDVFPAYYKIRARVKQANPTLTAHFVVTNPKMNISKDVCSAIGQHHPLLPMACLRDLHLDVKAASAAVVRACQYSYNFNFSLGDDTERKPIYRGAVDAEGRKLCGCYDADLAPVFSREKNLTASRCFSSICSSDQLMNQVFAQSDSVCLPLCDKAWTWLRSSNILKQSVADSSHWNLARFQTLCKQEIDRNKTSAAFDTAFSWRSFLFLLVPVTLLIVSVFTTFAHPKRTVSFLIKGLAALALTGMCILVGFATPSYLDCKSGPTCKSSLLHTPLAPSFCNKSGLEVCECREDSECEKSSAKFKTCGLFGACVGSVDGYRLSEPVYNTRIHGDYFMGAAVLAVCVAAACTAILWKRSTLVRSAIPPLAGVFAGGVFLGVGALLEVSRKTSKYVSLN